MFADLTHNKTLSVINRFALSVCIIAISCISAQAEKAKVPLYEYAVFYMETEGEFVIPVSVDAPAIYSWSEPKGAVKGDIPQIWQFLGIKEEIEYSFTEIESTILNHVASKDWQLLDLEITSVPIPASDTNFRTAYRYIFKRLKRD